MLRTAFGLFETAAYRRPLKLTAILSILWSHSSRAHQANTRLMSLYSKSHPWRGQHNRQPLGQLYIEACRLRYKEPCGWANNERGS